MANSELKLFFFLALVSSHALDALRHDKTYEDRRRSRLKLINEPQERGQQQQQHHHHQIDQTFISDLQQVINHNEIDQHANRGPKNCSSCVDRELFKNFTREEIKDKILRKLGMSNPPNVTADTVPMHLVRQLLSRYRGQLEMMNDEPENGFDDDEDDFHVQTKQVNVMAQTPREAGIEFLYPEEALHKWHVQYFHVNTAQLRNNYQDITKANVWIHLPPAPTVQDETAWVNVYFVTVDKNNHAFLTQEAATKVRMRADRGGWVEVNVWDAVMLWFKHPGSNLGLVMSVSTNSGEDIEIGVQNQPLMAPFLQLDIQEDLINNRNKRNLHKVCTEATDASETHCCLWPITIDFEKEFGWKWIIHPPKYEANYCAGDCSLGVMMPSNPYSHLLQQANGNPCCAPQKMSGMNMLYMDEDKNVILGKLPNMRVDRCGCI